jgi:putative hemolysin
MDKKGLLGVLIFVVILLVVGFFWFTRNYEAPEEGNITNISNETNATNPELANPASIFCVNQGHISEIRGDENGQTGYCISSDGQECEEWAFFRGGCAFENSKYCVQDSCCHPSSCILSDEILNCDTEICTMSCQIGTMDCGAGSCAFVNGNCEVKWNE